MVYGVIGIGDAINLVFILTMICLGKYGNAKEEAPVPADVSAMSNKITDSEGNKDFGDQIPEVPF